MNPREARRETAIIHLCTLLSPTPTDLSPTHLVLCLVSCVCPLSLSLLDCVCRRKRTSERRVPRVFCGTTSLCPCDRRRWSVQQRTRLQGTRAGSVVCHGRIALRWYSRGLWRLLCRCHSEYMSVSLSVEARASIHSVCVGVESNLIRPSFNSSVSFPPPLFEKTGQRVKQYRGMGSSAAMLHGSDVRYLSHETAVKIPQGVSGYVRDEGTVYRKGW